MPFTSVNALMCVHEHTSLSWGLDLWGVMVFLTPKVRKISFSEEEI